MLYCLLLLAALVQAPATKPIETAHLTMAATATPAGKKVTLALDVTPKPKMHVYSPGQEGYIAITLTLDANPAITASGREVSRRREVLQCRVQRHNSWCTRNRSASRESDGEDGIGSVGDHQGQYRLSGLRRPNLLRACHRFGGMENPASLIRDPRCRIDDWGSISG